MKKKNYISVDIKMFESPIPEIVIEEVKKFWLRLFGPDDEDLQDYYSNAEIEYNRDIIFIARVNGHLAGTAHLAISKTDSRLGSLGAVGTERKFRGRGISSKLCEIAVEIFLKENGKALFLGTENPAAARIYMRYGWQRLPGTIVMVNTPRILSPEIFLVDYFRMHASSRIIKGGPYGRVGIIPLIVTPHVWQVLDANAEIYSTRHEFLQSCNGLYQRYSNITANGRGTWFSGITKDGRIIGLGTVRIYENECRVDAFTHAAFMDAWQPLIKACLKWVKQHSNNKSCIARVSTMDRQKIKMFEEIGFVSIGKGKDFELAKNKIPSVILKKNC